MRSLANSATSAWWLFTRSHLVVPFNEGNRQYEWFAFAIGRGDLNADYFEEGGEPFPTSLEELERFHESVTKVVKAILSHGRVTFDFSHIKLPFHKAGMQ